MFQPETLSIPLVACGSFVIAFSGAVMPGPLLTVTITESSRRGATAGPLLILGHGLLEALMVTALLLGLGPFLRQESVAAGVGIIGAGVLVWMAAGLFRSIPSLSVVKPREGAAPGGSPVIAGALMSLANPYWTVWWATIGLAYLGACRHLGLAGVTAFFTGHVVGDLVWYAAVSWTFTRGRRFLSNTAYRVVTGVCGTALVFFAVWFASQGACKAALAVGARLLWCQ